MRPRPIAHISPFRIVRSLSLLAMAGLIGPLTAQQPLTPAPPPGSDVASGTASVWHSDQAVHLIGFPEVGEKSKGVLSVSPETLSFVSPQGHSSIGRPEISDVSVGEVRIESGGTAGKVTRAIIPFGGGAAVATVTHKEFSLLTIEFRDEHNALHGTVFLLPKNDAVQAQQRLGLQVAAATPEPAQAPCPAGMSIQPGSVRVAAIATLGNPVPAEYRVLLYEQLVHRLQEQDAFTRIDRDGDDVPEAACPQYNLVLTMDAFKKGNAAVRASTGPLGFFVGTTSLKFHVQVKDANGTMLFDKDLKVSKRGDTDSLNVAEKIADSLTKDLKKASARAARS